MHKFLLSTLAVAPSLLCSYTTVQVPSMNIVGIECRTINTPDRAPIDIGKLWERFYTEKVFDKIPNKTSNETLALYCDYEGDYTKPYSVVIGCRVDSFEQLPEGLVVKTLPATSYAVFKAIGKHPDAVIKGWNTIWQTELKRTYTGDFEVYGEGFQKDPAEVDIFIAIQ